MPAKRRPPIPKHIEREVLFRNQSVCCICQKPGVQIHHIDGNPSNNAVSNLCVLCIGHHAEASSKSSMLRHLSPGLLRKYKAHWEGVVALRFHLAAAKRDVRQSRFERREVVIEIKRAVYRLNGESSASRINATVNYLWAWCLAEADRKDVIKAIGLVHWLLETRALLIITSRLHEFFYEMVGPAYISMTAKRERDVIGAIKLLGDIGVQAVVFELNAAFFRRLGKALKPFSEIGSHYRRKRIINAVEGAVDSIRKHCEDPTSERKFKLLLASSGHSAKARRKPKNAVRR